MIKFSKYLPGASMALALALVGNALAAPVTWLYDSRIYANETEIQNLDGSYTYNLTLKNNDVYDIWLGSLYTGDYQARNWVSSIAPWQTFAYSNSIAAGDDWSLAGNSSTWMATFYDDADAPFAGSLGVGQIATLGFTVDGLIDGPISYGYFVRDDYEWNRFTAVGSAVPEPSSLALMALGMLAVLGFSFYRRSLHGKKSAIGMALASGLLLAACQNAPEENSATAAKPRGTAFAAETAEPTPPPQPPLRHHRRFRLGRRAPERCREPDQELGSGFDPGLGR